MYLNNVLFSILFENDEVSNLYFKIHLLELFYLILGCL